MPRRLEVDKVDESARATHRLVTPSTPEAQRPGSRNLVPTWVLACDSQCSASASSCSTRLPEGFLASLVAVSRSGSAWPRGARGATCCCQQVEWVVDELRNLGSEHRKMNKMTPAERRAYLRTAVRRVRRTAVRSCSTPFLLSSNQERQRKQQRTMLSSRDVIDTVHPAIPHLRPRREALSSPCSLPCVSVCTDIAPRSHRVVQLRRSGQY